MNRSNWLLGVAPLLFTVLPLLPRPAVAGQGDSSCTDVKHVLLLSIDGLHALDLANYIKAKPHSHFAVLTHEGVTFTNATTARPSDLSLPGLLALVTGASPISTGVWYDDSYDRALSPPQVAGIRDGFATLPRHGRHPDPLR